MAIMMTVDNTSNIASENKLDILGISEGIEIFPYDDTKELLIEIGVNVK